MPVVSVPAPLDPEFVALQTALAGQYSLERELGRGGMGIVYLAREVRLERHVAIKLLPPGLASRPDLRERFLREARTAARLSHPNIVPIHRVDEVAGFVFIVMAYIEGETLAQRIKARGPMNPSEATRVLRETAWALAYAHARGIVHRDIKPDNIIIESGTKRALVMDFGIAQIAEASSITESGIVMGTAHFMSPEQATGEPLDGRSDLYSLGVVGYLMLAGELPFNASTVASVLAMHLTQAARPLSAAAPDVPRKLAAVVDRCLAKSREERWPSGEALADALGQSGEHREEVPAPVRVWLTKGQELKPIYGFWAIVSIASASDPSMWTPVIIGAPLVFHAGVRLHQTRRLFATGYGVDDIRVALRSVMVRRREEVAVEHAQRPALFARLLRGATYLCGAATAAGFVAMLAVPEMLPFLETLEDTVYLAFATVTGAAIGLVYPGRRVSGLGTIEHRVRFWGGRLGEGFAKLAAFRLPRRATPEALANRPTELAIGLAADELFAALPRETQRAMRDLPAVVRRLEEDAQRMRKKIAQCDEALVHTDVMRPGSLAARAEQIASPGEDELDVRRRSVVEDLRSAKDQAGRRLAVAVAALENIRLDLLRLQAGAGTLDSLTAALEAARHLGDEAVTLAAAREEVADVVRTPG